jgi:hypothetical protein
MNGGSMAIATQPLKSRNGIQVMIQPNGGGYRALSPAWVSLLVPENLTRYTPSTAEAVEQGHQPFDHLTASSLDLISPQPFSKYPKQLL